MKVLIKKWTAPGALPGYGRAKSTGIRLLNFSGLVLFSAGMMGLVFIAFPVVFQIAAGLALCACGIFFLAAALIIGGPEKKMVGWR